MSEDFKRDNTKVISFGLALGEVERILTAHGANCLKFHLPPGISQPRKSLGYAYSHEETPINSSKKENNEQKNIVDSDRL